MTLQSGSSLGLYEILAPLGSGGMGEVYRARDSRLQREVAIKILPEAFADDAERLARFEREARILAALNHPAIATIHGLEHDGARRYIVMELVSGETLADRLGTGPMPVAEVVRLGRQIAEGLEAAHAGGVIHCDLKPANIAVTADGRVKLLDFGLARAFAPEAPSQEQSRSPTITAELGPPRSVFGTVSYMSPEQARGREIDKRTDIWAFGCVLYEMLSGRKAFAGETIPDTLAQIFEADPDWGALPPKTPSNVRDLMRRCIQKDPSRRLRDIGDARIELDDTISGQTRELPEASVRKARGRRRLALGAAMFLAAAILGTYLVSRSQAERPTAAAGSRQLAVLPFRNLTGSPDGDLWGLAMVETVSTLLSDVSGLQVVTPRATVEAVDQDPSFVRLAQRLGANTLLAGTLQRENERFRITYRLVDAKGNQLAAAAIDGSALFALQNLVADAVVRDLHLRRGARRTPTPVGLVTASQQERYLQALGHLQRYDRPADVDASVALLETLATESPAAPLVQAALGRAYLARFNLTRDPEWVALAEKACTRARDLQGAFPEVDVTLGDLALKTGRPADAAANFERALAAQPNNFDATLGLARAEDESGNAVRAEAAYSRAIALQPAYFAGYSKFAAFFFNRGRYDRAAEMFRKATELAPDNARAFANLGAALLAAGSFDRAIAAFRKSVALQPNDLAFSNLGTAQYYLGRYADAAVSYEKAVGLTPGHYQNWANFGDALRQIPGRETQASAAFEKAIALSQQELATNSRDAVVRSFLALCLAKTGRTAEARNQVEQALAVSPEAPEILYNASIVSNRAGQSEQALARLREALAAGYNAEIARREPELENLRETPEFQEIIRNKKPLNKGGAP